MHTEYSLNARQIMLTEILLFAWTFKIERSSSCSLANESQKCDNENNCILDIKITKEYRIYMCHVPIWKFKSKLNATVKDE